ncbi:DUF2721 domain-containing protein [Phormidium sp. CCY1219]|jgi:hypothetical protein|uniref:DUF2721 domain-containing protein n=1 Tax=Phormidium sp. CCY1219 TaxID=2886104 RepID=UPI002D1F83F1|nr:DUF2721 domain-containing protein [Phormidium sp. CCY1219]MEB3827887.1 DUF2721 domain-containing protein [Phormidium sp. CCY1219]
MSITATQSIQAILAPAVMISSSSLFFLGLNARHSALLTRIRLLTDEKRKIGKELTHRGHLEADEDVRLGNIRNQLKFLLRRAKFVRNSVFCNAIAAVLFVFTSLSIGLDYLMPTPLTGDFPLIVFILGMLLFLAGVTLTGIDEFISYSVILMEVKEAEATGDVGKF